MTPELRRILDLPRRPPAPPTDLPPRTASLGGLWPCQAWALAELETGEAPRGLFAPLGVGHGKTLISVLAPYVADVRDAVLLVPGGLVPKTRTAVAEVGRDYPHVRDHLPRVLSLDALSRPKGARLLLDSAPGMVVVDEAHAILDRRSARTKRIVDFAVRNPHTRWVFLSGTLLDKSLGQVAHLLELAFRDEAPIPLTETLLTSWAAVVDFESTPEPQDLAYLTPLAEAFAPPGGAFESPQDRARKAFRQRLIETPGVIASAESAVGTALYIRKLAFPAPDAVVEALANLKRSWSLPDGTEFDDPLDYHRHAATLAWGFYYRLGWSFEGRDGTPTDAEVGEWSRARREWTRAVTRQIEWIEGWEAADGASLDSPARVEAAARAGTAHRDVVAAWRRWEDVQGRLPIVQASTPVWLTRDAVDRVVEYLGTLDRALVWYQSRALEEALGRAGLRVYGSGAPQPPASEARPALSIPAHGTGKNLQAWHHNVVLEPPASAKAWEQLIGRTHRAGQRADEVVVEVPSHAWPLRARLYKAKIQAEYVAKINVSRPKLLLATWV